MNLKAKLKRLFTSEGADGALVDAMLVLCVHEADVAVQPAAGAALRKLAKDALGKADSSLRLQDDAFVRFGLVGSGAAPGLPPGGMGNMFAESGMPADLVKKMHYLAGGQSLSKVEEETEADLPREMKKLMRERDLAFDSYELRSFKESPDPGVKFLWIAAVRK